MEKRLFPINGILRIKVKCNILIITEDIPKIIEATTVPPKDPRPPKVTITIAKIRTFHPIAGLKIGEAEKEDVNMEAKPTKPIPIPDTIAVIFLILIPANEEATSSWDTALIANPIREYFIKRKRPINTNINTMH